MRQELKNLRLAVDKEEGRPLKIPKVDEGGGLRRRGYLGVVSRGQKVITCKLTAHQRKAGKKSGKKRKEKDLTPDR